MPTLEPTRTSQDQLLEKIEKVLHIHDVPEVDDSIQIRA
jgi:hypothetical protein